MLNFFWRLPMYGEMKLAFFIYLWYPKTKVKRDLHRFKWNHTSKFTMFVSENVKNFCIMKGTGYVYETMLRPYVLGREPDIDHKLLEWRARAWDLAVFYWQNCTELGQTAFLQVLEKFAAQTGRFRNIGTQVGSLFHPVHPVPCGYFHQGCSWFP